MNEILLAIISAIILLLAIAGVFVPGLPGPALGWLGLFAYAIGTGFTEISVTTVVVFFVITVLVMALDFLAPVIGAKKFRASRYGIAGAVLGLIMGVVFLGFWGIIVGPLTGAFVFELAARRRAGIAFRAALGTLVGFLAGTLVKTVLVLTMLGFLIAAWF